MNNTRKCLLIGMMILVATKASSGWAEITVVSPTWPTELPLEAQKSYQIDYNQESSQKSWPDNVSGDYYGNGHTDSFEESIDGGRKLTTQEQKELQSQMPEKLSNRYYVRIGVVPGTLMLRDIKNKSPEGGTGTALNIENANVVEDEKEQKEFSYEIAIGKTWKKWRIEGEYLSIADIEYNQTPLFTGRSEVITSDIKNTTLLANIYYDFDEVWHVLPYIMIGGGIGRNTVTTKITGGAGDGVAKKRSNLGLAFGAGLGVRYQIYRKFLIHAGYRMTTLGSVVWEDNTGSVKLEPGFYTTSGFTLGVSYLF